MTNREIIEKWSAIQYLKGCGVTLNEKINYARFRNEKTLKPLIESYEETRVAVIENHCSLSNIEEEARKGIYAIPIKGTDERAKYEAALKSLDQIEVLDESAFHWIAYTDVKSMADTDPMLFSSLMEIVKE